MNILFEDNHLIAVGKMAGEIVQADKTGDESLEDKVKLFLKTRDHKPGKVFLGVCHRIDRPVSGVVLFAKTSKSLERMNEQFRTRKVFKKYWAVVKNPPPSPEGTLIHYIARNEAKNLSKAYREEVNGSKISELTYQVVLKSDRYFLLEIFPKTGRHHQIRVQLSFIGCPIKGDLKYGYPRSNPDGSIHLHARSLQFSHPVTKSSLEITAPPPAETLWKFIESTLAVAEDSSGKKQKNH